MKRFILTTSLFFLCIFSFGQISFQKSFPEIDMYIDSIMKDWNIPGLALGIVYNDHLIYSKGYGYRDVENKLPILPSTLFTIASNTKLFTATAAVMLQEDGKLNLDKPVRTLMPSLSFYNDDLNNHVTLRDMLSHRTGLPTYDFIWDGDFTRKEVVNKISLMKPILGLREGYIYNNMMYIGVGAVMESVTGKSWEDIIREKLLNPLQMTSTVFSTEEKKKIGNYALSYFEKDSTHKLAVYYYVLQTDAIGPAGGIKSSVEDMSHWMIAQLNKGMYAGKQVIPENAINETIAPNTIIEKATKYDELTVGLYGLGRIMKMYKGVNILTHTGSLDGFYSNLTFIPKSKIGIFMVHNGSRGGAIRSVMAFPIIDKLLGLSFTPWSSRYLANEKINTARDKHIEDSIKNNRVKGTFPSHVLTAYVGNYINPLFGEFKVELINNTLQLTAWKITATLNHIHYDYFGTNQDGTALPSFNIKFLTNEKGEIDRFSNSDFGDEEFFVRK